MRVAIGIAIQPRDMTGRIGQTSHAVERAASRVLEALALLAQREARRQAPVDTGMLRASIGIDRRDALRLVVGTAARYAAAMEEGAKPHWPPPQPIERWVWRNRAKFGVTTATGRAARGGAARRRVQRIAYRVRRVIARRGLKGRGYMRQAYQRVQARVPQMARQAGMMVIRELRRP